jgi:hypothetical protein
MSFFSGKHYPHDTDIFPEKSPAAGSAAKFSNKSVISVAVFWFFIAQFLKVINNLS